MIPHSETPKKIEGKVFHADEFLLYNIQHKPHLSSGKTCD